MELIYQDEAIVVCVKPARVLSTDEPGGLPELIRKALGDEKVVVKTVHRLDRAVGGLMVLARTARAASDISKQIETGLFEKEYTAVAYGFPPAQGLLEDYLKRDPARKMTYVVPKEEKDARIARLNEPIKSGCSFPAAAGPWWETGNMLTDRTSVILPSGPPGWYFTTLEPARKWNSGWNRRISTPGTVFRRILWITTLFFKTKNVNISPATVE